MNTDLPHYPINDVVNSIKKELSAANKLLVSAETGAGKSTVLPLHLFNDFSGKIIMLEPRRLAAISIAHRMAELLNEEIGNTVGYRVRFDSRVSENTKLEIVTEGTFLRMLEGNTTLEGIDLVIFDEFHERSLQSDLALTISLHLQNQLREDLKLLVMSATLQLENLQHLLQCKHVHAKGRMFPVEVTYSGHQDEKLIAELVAATVQKALADEKGDILVFLPGEAEIKQTETLLKKNRGIQVYPLYGRLPLSQQHRAMFPHPSGKQKIVLATNIAETSLTIEGIKMVIDSGLTRQQTFNPNTGLSRLETAFITQDTAEQRKGRAGRLSEGRCIRMWSEADQMRMKEHRVPEIAQADLTALLLNLYALGESDIENLPWVDAPPKGKIKQAKQLLIDLEAIENEKITAHGKAMQAMGCHPRLAHMLLQAEDESAQLLACDLAALLEEKDLLPKDSGIDINLRIDFLRRQRAANTNSKRIKRIEKIAERYRKLLTLSEIDNTAVNPFVTGYLLVQAFPERIASSRRGNNAQFQLANGSLAMAGHKDDLAFEQWIVVASMDARGGMGKIFLASPLDPKDLAPLIKQTQEVRFNKKTEEIEAVEEMRIGSLILQSKKWQEAPLSAYEDAILEGLRAKPNLWFAQKNIQTILEKIKLASQWKAELNWPVFTESHLLATLDEWLLPYLAGITDFDEATELPFDEYLEALLNAKQKLWLNQHLPSHWVAPTGNKFHLIYDATAKQVSVKVRIQELFGLAKTPKVNENRTPILFQLLSPGYKPVQLTQDLENFWKETYFEVRKELKGRYPKHYWPDNPLEHEPTARAKPRKN